MPDSQTSIPSAFRLSLECFDLEDDTATLRHQIWSLLAPNMRYTFDRYVERVSNVAPYYRDTLANNRERFERVFVAYTEKLFVERFSLDWVSDTKKRTNEESELGFDLCGRGVIAVCIFTELLNVLGKHYRFAGRKTA